MKFNALPLALIFLPLYAHSEPSETPGLPAAITVVRTADGCDITLPPDKAKNLVDKITLSVDGKSEPLVGYYDPDALAATKSIHYIATASSDLDGQVKDILKAQGFPVKPHVTTYHIACGIGLPQLNGTYDPAVETLSKTLHFAHRSYAAVNLLALNTPRDKIGDKIILLDSALLDSSITMKDALGPNNDISSGKLVHLPNNLLHRITITVQFVPK